MANTATITKSGQITLPKWAREAIGVLPGQRVVFRRTKNGITIEREKTAQEIADNISALIPDEAYAHHMQEYAGLTSAEMREKWAESEDARAFFKEEQERTQ
ncbi:AbrB/MazE/SpoVT family DNA-binding domain-containing protein [Candidatus Saccharibacteria bacterium]|nr:AbrB/MazE/SpoVT family DNA-binding domain-containing protein [Candidatus Saccharibacteria bacterium]